MANGTLLALSGVCDLSWSLFDGTRKKLAERLPTYTTLTLLMVLQVLAFAALWVWQGSPVPTASGVYWIPAVLSLLLNLLGNTLFLRSVCMAPLSLSVPMLSLTPAVAALCSQWWFGETLHLRQWGGIALVMVGMAWLAFPPKDKEGSAQEITPTVLKGLGLMALCAVCFAVTPVVDKASVAVASPLFHSVFLCGSLAVVFGALALQTDWLPAKRVELIDAVHRGGCWQRPWRRWWRCTCNWW
jgi:drug/metabolite transporter (DMT)-like permease